MSTVAQAFRELLTDDLPPSGFVIDAGGGKHGCVQHEAGEGLRLELLAYTETREQAFKFIRVYGSPAGWSPVPVSLDEALNIARAKPNIHGVGVVDGPNVVMWRCIR